MGLEATPDEWVQGMVDVFREVRRVLRPDGTLWLNIGDSYNNRAVSRPSSHQGGLGFRNESIDRSWADHASSGRAHLSITSGGLKEKDLLGIPWMLAFALRADGWYLRADIIWSKPNPMPESVTDRPTKAHEYLFLLSKSRTYHYDADAIREEVTSVHSLARNGSTPRNFGTRGDFNGDRTDRGRYADISTEAGRNKRSVWTVATQSFPESHFATYPTALIEPCIKAGTSERGCCPECGAPWVRQVEQGELLHTGSAGNTRLVDRKKVDESETSAWSGTRGMGAAMIPGHSFDRTTVGWRASCGHAGEPQSCTVLDPFAGAFTTALVAERLGRDSVMVEINPSYVEMGRKRVVGDAPMFTTVEVA